jgi:hypothetical protein
MMLRETERNMFWEVVENHRETSTEKSQDGAS